MNDFDNSETASFLLIDGSSYSIGHNISKQPEKEGSGFEDLEQDLTTFDILESELSEPPIEESSETNSGSIENSHQSEQALAPPTLYPGQITSGSASISRKLLENPSQPSLNSASPNTPSSLAQIRSTRIP